MKDIIVMSYLIYIFISVVLTIWVARTLHKRGAIFLVDAFQGNAELAASVNHLLVVGFYLINLGWIAMTLQTRRDVSTARFAIELLSDKVGTVLFLLGIMHFFNLYLFSYFRRRALDRLPTATPPIPPTFFKAPESAR